MGVVVFDSDVLIGFLNASDAHHQDARDWMQAALAPGTRRVISAVNYSEILIGPARAGEAERDRVDSMLGRLGIEIITVDMELARTAAGVRARTGLDLPDAYALATCIHAERRGWSDVQLATFDRRVLKAHAELHPGRP